MEYRSLSEGEITRDLFLHFSRRQTVNDCWRYVEGEWVLRSDPFVDDWDEKDYEKLLRDLRNTIAKQGFVAGAFQNGLLKGFTAVKAGLMGSRRQYLDLASIHVSQDMRGQGIGRELFTLAKDWARAHGAKKLYISAHSAVETQAFYRAMGCTEAQEYDAGHVRLEPCDCQMECEL